MPVAGSTASYSVQLTPHPIYPSSINLSCTGLPTAAACNFTSASMTLQSPGPATSTLNITTTARPVVTPAASLWIRHFYAIWLVVPGLTLLGVGSSRKRRASHGGNHDVLSAVRDAAAPTRLQQFQFANSGERNASGKLHDYRISNVRHGYEEPDGHADGSVDNLRTRRRKKAHG